MFLPTTKNELKTLGWKSPDVIMVAGDTYVDSPYIKDTFDSGKSLFVEKDTQKKEKQKNLILKGPDR